MLAASLALERKNAQSNSSAPSMKFPNHLGFHFSFCDARKLSCKGTLSGRTSSQVDTPAARRSHNSSRSFARGRRHEAPVTAMAFSGLASSFSTKLTQMSGGETHYSYSANLAFWIVVWTSTFDTRRRALWNGIRGTGSPIPNKTNVWESVLYLARSCATSSSS